MKYIYAIIILLFNLPSFAQEREFLNDDFDVVKKSADATYYRIMIDEDSTNIFYTSGQIFMEGKYFNKKDKKIQGLCTWYMEDGTVDTQQNYDDGKYVSPVTTEKHKTNSWKTECSGCELPGIDENKVEWDIVVPLKGSKATLYEKALCVMSDFEDLGQVENIVESNEEQGKVSRRFSFDLYYGKTSSNYSGNMAWQKRGSVVFEISIYTKDDKYRMRIHDFKVVPLDGTGAYSLESVFDASNDLGMGLINKNQAQITQQVIYTIEGYFKKDQELIGYLELIPRKMTGLLSALRKKCAGQDLINDDW